MTEKETMKKQLTALHDQIMTELSTIATQHPESGDWIAVPDTDSSITNQPDQNVDADTTEEWNERRSIVAQLETRYQNIKKALANIESGDFGVCEVCQKQIEIERLQVNPAAKTCMEHLEG